ncbi:MAG TPA: hypothetical protein VLJ84_10660 [Usitatibacter sp.]|nr:hypothetical protein [Usitatibacter sp.]
MALFIRDPNHGDVPVEVGAEPRRGARWLDRLKGVVVRNQEPASRSFRYLARLIDRELGGRTTGLTLAMLGVDRDDSPADALLMLAYCLRSELDSRVLVIDARLKDIGMGLTGQLGLESAPGYAQLMRDGIGNQAALVQDTRVTGVEVLPAGHPVAGAAADLDRSTLRHLLEWARAEYDYVLLQVGSPLNDTRNAVTAAEADAVFLLADEHQTFMKRLDDCRHLLMANGAQAVKIIVAGGRI